MNLVDQASGLKPAWFKGCASPDLLKMVPPERIELPPLDYKTRALPLCLKGLNMWTPQLDPTQPKSGLQSDA